MKIFLTGASGYIGGSLAKKLIENGHSVLGLVRSQGKADQLQKLGLDPILGSLDDSDIVTEVAREADAVINAANSDHRPIVETVLKVLAGTGKPFVQTSGSSMRTCSLTDPVFPFWIGSSRPIQRLVAGIALGPPPARRMPLPRIYGFASRTIRPASKAAPFLEIQRQ